MMLLVKTRQDIYFWANDLSKLEMGPRWDPCFRFLAVVVLCLPSSRNLVQQYYFILRCSLYSPWSYHPWTFISGSGSDAWVGSYRASRWSTSCFAFLLPGGLLIFTSMMRTWDTDIPRRQALCLLCSPWWMSIFFMPREADLSYLQQGGSLCDFCRHLMFLCSRDTVSWSALCLSNFFLMT